MSRVRDLWVFTRAGKKSWLLPIPFGGLLVLAQGSAVAPFVYPIS
jgi:hypothetical protein